jgi:hypothetical protein
MTPMIEAAEVVRRFGKTTALNGSAPGDRRPVRPAECHDHLLADCSRPVGSAQRLSSTPAPIILPGQAPMSPPGSRGNSGEAA